MMEETRRNFIKKAALGAATLGFGGMLPGFSAKSYGRILGANEQLNVAVMGVNARGKALANNFALQPNAVITYLCDVDRRAAEKCQTEVGQRQDQPVQLVGDFRKALEDKNVDLLVVAAPDHWHAPAAILASQAGKHVYLEKPCSHNPREGELLVEAQKKYGNVIQMGNQRRSWPNVIAGIAELHAGVIGRPYYARTWYANNRKPIGTGKSIAVPDWLDYDLWQGPAPRKPYQDNLLHYNWHWFWHWGTGEALNNGTHFVDIARWGLQVDLPVAVTSSGGRYRYQDDWETPDTQIINLEFANKSLISWEGRSCNGKTTEGATVGVVFYGEEGSLQINGDNGYKIFDLKGEVLKEVKNDVKVETSSLTNPSQQLDAIHIQNLFSAIKNGEPLNSDIQSGHYSTLLVQLGNIAQRAGKRLETDPKTGRILNDEDTMNKYWSREYQAGWEPKV
ncbi:MAG: Gfo/Idh/MocA family oxidoreductase [Sphingobacterium sp.]